MSLQGGPEDEKPDDKPDSKASTTVEVTIAGQKYVVDKAMADALESEQKKLKAEKDALAEQLKTMKVQQPAVADPKQDQPDPLGDTDLLFTDTKAYLAKFRDQITQEVTTKLRQEYQLEKMRSQFWDRFYTINNDLDREHQLVVEAVMARDHAELSGLPVAEQYKELGERVRAEMLKIVGKKRDTNTDKKPVLEGGSTPSPRVPQGDLPASDQVVSISDVIAAQRKARIAARTKA